jgi:hypothetical protein
MTAAERAELIAQDVPEGWVAQKCRGGGTATTAW